MSNWFIMYAEHIRSTQLQTQGVPQYIQCIKRLTGLAADADQGWSPIQEERIAAGPPT